MMTDDEQPNFDRTEIVNPIAKALSRVVEQQAARPQHVYRLAVILEGVLESLEDPEALHTIRGELRALLNDLSQTLPESGQAKHEH
jgi:hypothetical protein